MIIFWLDMNIFQNQKIVSSALLLCLIFLVLVKNSWSYTAIIWLEQITYIAFILKQLTSILIKLCFSFYINACL